MIRLSLLWLFITWLALGAWKDWYRSLCGLILLMAVIEHPDMPKSIAGVQGLNPWNILLAIILTAWFLSRRREGLTWDMPRHINNLLLIYLAVILVAVYRMMGDRDGVIEFAILVGDDIPTTKGLVSEYIINSLKWVIPGLLLFDGCRSRRRFHMALAATLGVYFLLAIQVIKWMPLSSVVSGADLTERSLKILSNEIGYHRVNLSMMLAGASWAIFSTRHLVSRKLHVTLILGASVIALFGQALTGGRTGYATWGLLGVFLCYQRDRKYLFVAPVLACCIIAIIPGAKERMLQGFTPESRDHNLRVEEEISAASDEPHLYTITAGRNVAWPYVIEKIDEAPIIGHGRLAMRRTGISTFLLGELGEGFPHPHNAYLQLLLDNGLAGFLPIALFYFLVVKYSISLFKDSRSSIFIAIGGVSLSIVLALLIASFGSQTFYPREGAVGMWCAMGLMFRVYIERSRIPASAAASGSDDVDHLLWGETA